MHRLLTLPLLTLLLTVLLSSAVAHAELPLLTVDNTQLSQPVNVPSSVLLEDPSGNLTAAEVYERIARDGRTVQGVPRMGYSASAWWLVAGGWWLAFRLQAPLAERLDLIIDRAYLEKLNEAYARFFHDYDEAPLLIVNAATLDPLSNDIDYAELQGAIARMGRGRLYFNPLRHAAL